MSELLALPIFPLSIVQFPGVVTPLHIFEERYRQLISDIMPAGKRFGIVYLSDGEASGEEGPKLGQIGCCVEVIAHQSLPDGRSNILCAGERRFYLNRYLEGASYYQAEVEFFEDEATFADLAAEVGRAQAIFKQLLAVTRKLRDESEADEDDLPELPDDAAALSFVIAASLDAALEEKQEWLEMTDTAARLRIVSARMKKAVGEYEQRANVQKVAKTNGHGGKAPIPGE